MTAELVAEAWPFVTAALGGYGTAVLTRVQTQAADDTASWGRRMLQKAFGTRPADEPLPAPLASANAADPDSLIALRDRLIGLLTADPDLAAEFEQLVQQARHAGNGSTITATSYDNSQQNIVGQGTQTVNNDRPR